MTVRGQPGRGVPRGELGLRVASTLAVLLAPLLVLQGRNVRRRVPVLPEAPAPLHGEVAGTGAPLHLLLLGESTAAGVGAPSHDQGLAGSAARALALATGRPVRWRVLARTGATAAVVRTALLGPADEVRAEVAVIALGVNDTLALRSPSAWVRDLAHLVGALRERCGPVPVVLAAAPPMGVFPALPQPLRGVLGLRARLLDRAAERFARGTPAVERVPMPPMDEVDTFFCEDRFHPSTHGYRAWGDALGVAAARAVDLSD